MKLERKSNKTHSRSMKLELFIFIVWIKEPIASVQFCFQSDHLGTMTSWLGELPGSIGQPTSRITWTKLCNSRAPATSDGASAGMKKRPDIRFERFADSTPLSTFTTKIILENVVELFGKNLRSTIVFFKYNFDNIYLYHQKLAKIQ